MSPPSTARGRGRMSLVNALTHGNEICGAIALDHLFRVRHAAGARQAHADASPMSRPIATSTAPIPTPRAMSTRISTGCGTRRRSTGRGAASNSTRARTLRPLYDSADLLLDIHSMQYATAPLMLVGLAPKTESFARRVGVPALMVRDEGHAAGSRLRDYGAFADPDRAAHRAARRMRPALGAPRRRGRDRDELALPRRGRDPRRCGGRRNPGAARAGRSGSSPSPNWSSIATDDFRFSGDYRGLEVDRRGGHDHRPRRRPRHPHAL